MRNWIICSLFLFAACNETTAAPNEEKDFVKPALVFDGLIVATNSTKLRAPQNTFRIGGWNSSSSWIELKDLTKDGAEVKKGDMIGRFDFRGKSALPGVKERILKAEATRDQSSVSDTDTKASLLATIEKSKIDARRAELDLQRGNTVSKRDLAQFEITRQLAEFDAMANKKYASAQDAARYAESDFHDQNVDLAQADMGRFEMYKRRFTVRAPHDGIVRHAYHRRRNRKVQKGDGMPAGMHFASLSKDSTVAVDVYIPERHYLLARSAKSFLVKSPTSDEAFEATVIGVDEFPQTVGFIKEDRRIPNAQDRVYVVHAVFEVMPKEMSSGLEVKVEIP